MTTRYIHIGYPKTGSTTLQKVFFSQHPELLNIASPKVFDRIQRDVMLMDSLAYSHSKVEAVLAPYFDLADSRDEYKAVGLSYEGLCFSADGTNADRGLIAERLWRVFGDARIIITIRNQFGFIRSLYSEFIKQMGCYLSFNQFLEAHYWRFDTYLFHQLFYYDLYQCYEKLFGKERVRIFLYEQIARDLDKAIEDMCLFLNISRCRVRHVRANPSLSRVSLSSMRIINRIVKNSYGRSYFMPVCPGVLTGGRGTARELNWAPRGIERREAWRLFLKRNFRKLDRTFDFRTANLTFSEEWKGRIANLYRENNQKLMEETGLDLRTYNYPL